MEEGIFDANGVETDELIGAGLEGFGPLGLLSQSDTGDAEEVGFFLHARGVGEECVGVLEEDEHVEVGDGIGEEEMRGRGPEVGAQKCQTGAGMEGDDEGWVAPPPAGDGDAGLDAAAEHGAEAGAGGGPAAAAAAAAAPKEAEKEEGDQEDDGEDIPDLDDLEIVDEGDIDEAALPPAAVAASAAARAAKKAAAESERSPKQKNSNVVPVRTYDLSISYDKYYQVPRFWLAGFDEDRRPLRADALLEDGERREKAFFFFFATGGKNCFEGKTSPPFSPLFSTKKIKKISRRRARPKDRDRGAAPARPCDQGRVDPSVQARGGDEEAREHGGGGGRGEWEQQRKSNRSTGLGDSVGGSGGDRNDGGAS